ncbi:MAG: protein translocase subunit SecF [Methanomicrobiales archaeon]|nr:protein translocase subunit SecF [Methanomicrobiales archaeon]
MPGFTYSITRFPPWQMIIGPVAILIISCGILAATLLTTGMPVTPGIDFAGGTAVTLFSSDSEQQLRGYFSDYPLLSIEEGINHGWYLKFGPLSDAQFRDFTTHIEARYPDSKVDHIGETFGSTLQQQAVYALIFSFAGMTAVVFIAFRTLVPAAAVILSAFADIAMTAAVMNIVGIPLSLGTTAALLMLIGYSVDSDILLTTRVLKRKGKIEERFSGAFHTGFIMTTTTLAAVAAMWVVSLVGQIEIITHISSVLFIGLFVDIFNTWLTNAGILKWYVDRKGSK